MLVALATGCVGADGSSASSPQFRGGVEFDDELDLEAEELAAEVATVERMAQQPEHADESCGGNNIRPARFGWANGEDVRVDDTTVIPWTLTNQTDDKRSFDIVATADRGSLRPTVVVVDHVDLAPGARTTGEVDLHALKIDPSALRYSGLLMLAAVDPERDTTTVSEPIFFHADEKGRLVTYGEAMLQKRFGGGDLRRGGEAVDEDGVITTRVVSAVDIIRSDDDQLESDVRPDDATESSGG